MIGGWIGGQIQQEERRQTTSLIINNCPIIYWREFIKLQAKELEIRMNSEWKIITKHCTYIEEKTGRGLNNKLQNLT